MQSKKHLFNCPGAYIYPSMPLGDRRCPLLIGSVFCLLWGGEDTVATAILT